MNIAATVVFLQLCLSATASVSENKPTETVVTAEPGDVVLLSCYTGGKATPSSTTWTKNGQKVGDISTNPDGRLAVLHDGSLRFDVAKFGDEGSYLCNATLPDNSIFQARARLQLTSGPGKSMLIFPTILFNGTLIAKQGTVVYVHCTASSSPSQRLSLTFSGAPSSNNTLISTSQSSLDFQIENIQRSSQGVYTCSNTVSKWTVNRSTELLVYYVPDTHPDCMWVPSQNLSDIQLNCSWFGAYPVPKLRWGEAGDFQETENLSVNVSPASDGQTFKCTATHQLLREGIEKSCSLTLKSPYPEGNPMVTAVEGTRVTLTCTETTAFPPADTTWKKGVQKTKTSIEPGSKYVLSDKGPDYKLTILNVTKDDEGCYYCHSQNQLGYKYLEICLTVKTSSSVYTGGIIGVLIASLIVGSAVFIAKVLYSRRHQICLGGGFGDEDREDVLSLVESDDERIFQDTVPQLPPLANGRHTTLVEVHQIPSCDHEEAEPAELSPQQPEDTEQTEQEDLVTF